MAKSMMICKNNDTLTSEITKRIFLFFILALIMVTKAWCVTNDSCAMVLITPERLPDLNMPRSGHAAFYSNGELTLTGGHTTNFVPTPTAEYYADGQWHLLTMAYAHDNGFAVTLPSGEVIIGGGHTEPLGVGQTFMIERYMPDWRARRALLK